MNFLSAYNLLDAIVIAFLALFVVFLLSVKSKNRLSQYFLIAFIISLALSYMDGVFLSFSFQIHRIYAHMIYLTMSFDYLHGPLLMLYILSRIRPNFQFKPTYYLSFVPFLLHLSFLLYRYGFKSLATKQVMLKSGLVFSYDEIYALTTISNLHYAVYFVIIFKLLYGYQKAIKNHYSNLYRKNLNWLLLVSCGFFLGTLMRYLNNILWLEVPNSLFLRHIDLKLFAVSATLIFAAVLLYKNLQQPKILHLPIGDAEADPQAANQNKYKTTKILPEMRHDYMYKLKTYMQRQKPYLDADLNLNELAKKLNIPAHHLSQSINVETGKNFYEFVNDYRLLECISMLEDPKNAGSYITQIMYECGFNSKSVFNPLFKKQYGMTPSQYRQAL